MKNDKSKEVYHKTTAELKNEKLDWEFDDFLEKVNTASPEKKTDKSSNPNSNRSARRYWIAAAAVLLIGMTLLIKLQNTPTINSNDSFVKSEILRQKESDPDQFVVYQETSEVAPDSANLKKSDSVETLSADKEAQKVIETILPKKGRINRKPKEVYTSLKSPNPGVELNGQGKSNGKDEVLEENYVIINGQKITDRKEAIDVTTYSLRIVSNQINQAIAKADALNEIVEL